MVGTTLALIALATAATASSAVSAHAQSSAANKAAGIQTASANQAIDLQKQMWGQAQANAKPYMDLGSQAANTLGGAMGMGSVRPPQTAQQSNFTPSYDRPTPPPGGINGLAAAMQRPMMTGQPSTQQPPMGQPPMGQQPPQAPQAPAPTGPNLSGMVTIQAPDGTTQQVTLAQAQLIRQRDPQVVIRG